MGSRRRSSHPTGVRGLKLTARCGHGEPGDVAPHWGAWIEICNDGWLLFGGCRTPLGCVD